MINRAHVWQLITEERERQQTLWDHPHEWGTGDCSNPDLPDTLKLVILAEEGGEVARAVLERNPNQLRDELVQVAAVAVAWLESLPAPLDESQEVLPL